MSAYVGWFGTGASMTAFLTAIGVDVSGVGGLGGGCLHAQACAHEDTVSVESITLDQGILGSNPSAPAKPQDIGVGTRGSHNCLW